MQAHGHPTGGAAAPLDGAGRIQALDVVRGFALAGILLMNLEWFSRPLQQMGQGIAASASGLDQAAAWAVHTFVAGKFWVLFSLLFGMGFAVMASRGGRGPGFRARYVRRCLALLAFGVLHALLLWPGDILHTYAIAGLLLLALGGLDGRMRVVLGLALYGLPAMLVVAMGGLMSLASGELPDAARMAAAADADALAAAQVYAHGSYPEAVAQRARDFAGIVLRGDAMVVPMALGVFLLGAAMVGGGHLHDPLAQRGGSLRLALWTLPPGALLVALSLRIGSGFDGLREMGPMLLAQGVMMLGSLPLALGYFALVVLGLGVPGLSRALGWLAPAGRMALTLYLLQSLLAALLFHGYGLGLWGQVGRAGQVLLALAIFALQVALAHWWMARYRFGPMEWLWRWITYGARPPMRLAGPR